MSYLQFLAGDDVQFPSIFIVLKIKETCFFIFESITFL